MSPLTATTARLRLKKTIRDTGLADLSLSQNGKSKQIRSLSADSGNVPEKGLKKQIPVPWALGKASSLNGL
jgi:hypothetical protein